MRVSYCLRKLQFVDVVVEACSVFIAICIRVAIDPRGNIDCLKDWTVVFTSINSHAADA